MSNNPEDDLMEERKKRGIQPMAQQAITEMKPAVIQKLPTAAEAIAEMQRPQPSGLAPTTDEIISRNQKELAALKNSNDAIEAELVRMEKLKSQAYQAGKGFVHAPAPIPETPEEKWRREAKERYKGTGMDPT